MPAIAEDPQTAVPRGPDSDSGGGARTKVAARDLEAGLRAAVQAQRSLQARRRRRDKLLRALSQVRTMLGLKLRPSLTAMVLPDGTAFGCGASGQ